MEKGNAERVAPPHLSEKQKRLEQKLAEIVREVIQTSGAKFEELKRPRIETTLPTDHQTKREMLADLAATEGALGSIRDILAHLRPSEADDALAFQMADNLTDDLDLAGFDQASAYECRTHFDLIEKTVLAEGVAHISLRMLEFCATFLERRLADLKSQQDEFWSQSNRPPNHNARIVALRVARVYYESTGQVPTFGVARDGNHPSTDYGRHVEIALDAFGIRVGFRPPAEWAIKELQKEIGRAAGSGTNEEH